MNEIVEITNQEVKTSEEVLERIGKMATFIENASANAEEVSASTEETFAVMETISEATEGISNMANELNRSIEQFKTE